MASRLARGLGTLRSIGFGDIGDLPEPSGTGCARIAASRLAFRFSGFRGFSTSDAVVGRERVVFDYRYVLADEFFDVTEILALFAVAERNGGSRSSCAPGPTDAVDVRLGFVRKVVVHDELEVVDIDASGGDIGGHEDPDSPVFKSPESALSGVLGFVSVDGLGGNASFLEILDDLVRAVFRPGENEHLFERTVFENMDEKPLLIGTGHEIDSLGNLFGGRRYGRNFDPCRIFQDGFGKLHDFRRHRRRKEERLALFGNFRNDLANVVDESHVEHPVGFIQNKNADMAEIDVSLTHKVEESSRSRYENVDTLGEAVGLRPLPYPAENHRMAESGIASVRREGIADLDREFASRREHEAANRALVALGGLFFGSLLSTGEELDDRKGKGGRFSGSRLRATDEVATGKDGRDTARLNRGGRFVPLVGKGSENRLGKSEVFELGHRCWISGKRKIVFENVEKQNEKIRCGNVVKI